MINIIVQMIKHKQNINTHLTAHILILFDFFCKNGLIEEIFIFLINYDKKISNLLNFDKDYDLIK